jgi:hypothetical protein
MEFNTAKNSRMKKQYSSEQTRALVAMWRLLHEAQRHRAVVSRQPTAHAISGSNNASILAAIK